jgi:lysophospholipase L1-like esterase
VFQSVYTGGGYYLLVDGQFVGAFGGNTRNTSAGSGIFAHAGGGFMVNGRIYYGVFASGGIISGTSGLTVSSTLSAQRRAIERYLVRKVPAAVRVPRVLCFGDSQTNGGNLSNKVTDSYPGQLATALGSAATVNRLGNPGNTSTQIAALYGSQLDPNISPIDASTTVVIEVGTNNLLQASGTPSDASTIAASIVADINTIASSARSAGASKIIATNVPACKGISDDSTRETWRQALNTAVRALDNGSTFRCADVAARPELSTFTNHTYFDAADEIHFTATGYGVWKDVIYALL